MSILVKHSPFIGLIDDDCHSARLFMRMFAEAGGPAVCHFGDGEAGLTGLERVLDAPAAHWPDAVVVDLKDHSRANLDFVASHHDWLRDKDVDLVVMVPPTDRDGRSTYHEAGAVAVFFRQPELDTYRRELAGIAQFWARNRRLDTVGM